MQTLKKLLSNKEKFSLTNVSPENNLKVPKDALGIQEKEKTCYLIFYFSSNPKEKLLLCLWGLDQISLHTQESSG